MLRKLMLVQLDILHDNSTRCAEFKLWGQKKAAQHTWSHMSEPSSLKGHRRRNSLLFKCHLAGPKASEANPVALLRVDDFGAQGVEGLNSFWQGSW